MTLKWLKSTLVMFKTTPKHVFKHLESIFMV